MATCHARQWIGLLILMMGIFGGLQAEAAETEGAPKLVFPESSYQFTSAVEGQSVVHEFVVKNAGDAMLKIERVKSG